MNSEWLPTASQVDGLARAGVAILTGYLAAKGVDGALVASIGAFILTGITIGWSILVNRQKALIKEVAKDPAVEKIVVDNAKLANSIPSEKVVESDPVRNL